MSNLRTRISSLKLSFTRGLRNYIERKANDRWNNFPFGKQPKAGRETYMQLAIDVRKKTYPTIDIYERDSGFSINADWMHDLALHTQVVIKESDLCYQHGRILYSTLSKYLHDNPINHPSEHIHIWETGTARGFSALCMAKALSEHERSGTIYTFDVLPHVSKMYWNCIDDLDGPKTRHELLEPWQDLVARHLIFHQGDSIHELPKVQTARIHFAFLDGMHTYEDVLFEFEQIKNCQHTGDVIVYDDYSPMQFPGLVKAVDEICESYGYSRITLNANEERGYVVAKKL